MKENMQESVSVQGAEAQETKGTAETPLLGKFKSVDALLDAYNSLEAEFTRRSQRLRELGGEIGKRRERRGTETCRRDLADRRGRVRPFGGRRPERRCGGGSRRAQGENHRAISFQGQKRGAQRSGGGRFVRGRSQSARENAGRSRQTGGGTL